MKKKSKSPKPVLNEAAREYFRVMGAIGGRRTAAKLTPEERRASAINAINARWNKARIDTESLSDKKTQGEK